MAFFSDSVLEDIAKDASSAGRYINPSKLNGEVRLRIFGAGKSGWEAWTTDNKPVRWPMKPEKLPANIRKQEGFQPIKHVLFGVVFDYAADDFKVLQITQKTLKEQLAKYQQDPDYGDPVNYDIKIGKTGEGKETKYTIVPSPPKPVNPAIQARYDELYCDLDALYEGGDPFTPTTA